VKRGRAFSGRHKPQPAGFERTPDAPERFWIRDPQARESVALREGAQAAAAARLPSFHAPLDMTGRQGLKAPPSRLVPGRAT